MKGLDTTGNRAGLELGPELEQALGLLEEHNLRASEFTKLDPI